MSVAHEPVGAAHESPPVSPAAHEPTTAAHESAPAAHEPVSATHEPATAGHEPATEAHEPVRTAHEPAPVSPAAYEPASAAPAVAVVVPATLGATSSVVAGSTQAIILGDSNLRGLTTLNSSVHTFDNGRPSKLLFFARTELTPDSNITKVFVCLSTLDRRNRLITLTTSLKSPLSKCCLLYTSPSPRDLSTSRMPSSA